MGETFFARKRRSCGMKMGFVRSLCVLFVVLLAGCANQGHSDYGRSYDQNYDQNYGSSDGYFSPAQLDQMLAPIALYPDSLLSQILMAATYPGEVYEAANWTYAHPNLEGASAVSAVEDERWDDSVKSLVAFPDVLARMHEDPQWTEDLGNAFLVQQGDVADAIQRLRDRAYSGGQLESNSYTRVYRSQQRIYIEPVSPTVVYLPYYDPFVVYGRWWWPDYPPHRWSVYVSSYGVNHFYWGHGIRVAPLFFYSTFHWPERRVVIVNRQHYLHHYSRPGHYQRYDGARHWYHKPEHRRGYDYPSRYSSAGYGDRNAHDSRQRGENYRRGEQGYPSNRGQSPSNHYNNGRQPPSTGPNQRGYDHNSESPYPGNSRWPDRESRGVENRNGHQGERREDRPGDWRQNRNDNQGGESYRQQQPGNNYPQGQGQGRLPRGSQPGIPGSQPGGQPENNAPGVSAPDNGSERSQRGANRSFQSQSAETGGNAGSGPQSRGQPITQPGADNRQRWGEPQKRTPRESERPSWQDRRIQQPQQNEQQQTQQQQQQIRQREYRQPGGDERGAPQRWNRQPQQVQQQEQIRQRESRQPQGEQRPGRGDYGARMASPPPAAGVNESPNPQPVERPRVQRSEATENNSGREQRGRENYRNEFSGNRGYGSQGGGFRRGEQGFSDSRGGRER